jgi:hypothetical protein
MAGPPVEVADVVRTAGPVFIEHSRRWLTRLHRTVTAIERCRTAALGDHVRYSATRLLLPRGFEVSRRRRSTRYRVARSRNADSFAGIAEPLVETITITMQRGM